MVPDGCVTGAVGFDPLPNDEERIVLDPDKNERILEIEFTFPFCGKSDSFEGVRFARLAYICNLSKGLKD